MISQYWVNQISLSEVCLAGDTIVVRGEIPHAASTTAPTCGEQHLKLETPPCPFHTKSRLLSKHSGWKKPDTSYLMESQVLNRCIMQQLVETAKKRNGCGQRCHHTAKEHAGRGTHWGTLEAGFMPSRHAHSLLGRFFFRQEGWLPKIPKQKCLNSQGALYIFHLPASPFLPLLSLHTTTAFLSLHLLELLSALYWPLPCYSFFPYLYSCFVPPQ